MKQDTTDSGDVCHFLVLGLPKSYHRELVKKLSLKQLMICDFDGERELATADLGLDQLAIR